MRIILILSLLIPSTVFADRSFYSAYSLVPGATIQGNVFFPSAYNTTNSTFLIGQSARVADQASAGFISSTDVNFNIQALFQQSTNDVNGNLIYFNKTRKTDFTADTIVANGDAISTLLFQGADGASFRNAAAIKAEIDGVPGASDMPGRLSFLTTLDGTAALVERLRISNNGSLGLERTNTAGGTTGAQTINKMAGSVNFAAAATSLVVTNSLVTATSNVFCVVQTNDATATIKNCVPASGSFTITLNAAATAETRVAFWVTN